MPPKIQHKRSAVAGKAPQPADLDYGEIAVNYEATDPALYVKDSADNIVKLAGSGSVGDDWTRTGTDLSPKTNGDSLQLKDGTGTVSVDLDAGASASPLVRDSSGRLGIGTTSPTRSLQVYDSSNAIISAKAGSAEGFINTTSTAVNFESSSGIPLTFSPAGSLKATLDTSGRLLVGTSSARTDFSDSRLYTISQIEYAENDKQTALSITANAGTSNTQLTGATLALSRSNGTTVGSNTLVTSGARLGTVSYRGADGSNLHAAATIEAFVDGTPGADDMPGRLVFSTTADGASGTTERMRIAQDGACQYYANTSFNVRTARTSTTADAFSVHKGASSTTTGTLVFQVMADGDCENTNNAYGAISDVKLKENIVDANSQWDDLKAIQVRNYSFKKETSYETHRQIGLIAQEVEQVSPGLVTESPDRDAEGNYLGTVTKSVNYSVLYMKAVKALQEAMERIETLEAKVAALESA